jgi:hypothetical protein
VAAAEAQWCDVVYMLRRLAAAGDGTDRLLTQHDRAQAQVLRVVIVTPRLVGLQLGVEGATVLEAAPASRHQHRAAGHRARAGWSLRQVGLL